MNLKNIANPQKIFRAMALESRALKEIIKYGYPDALLQFLGGLGDEVILTCVAHELKKRNPDMKIWQISAAATLLENNPDYSKVFDPSRWELRHSNLLNMARIKLGYSYPLDGNDVWEVPEEHIIIKMLYQAGVRGEVELRPYVYLTKKEKENGALAKEQICIQSVGFGTHETWMKNKLWIHERWIEAAKEIKRKYPSIKIIQIGSKDDLPLESDYDLRGKTNLRESAALLSVSRLFAGTQGLLGHLSRAVDTRSVIVMGGREHAWQSGYKGNIYLERFPECSPCWAMSRCDYEHKCMTEITVQEVVNAIEKGLEMSTIDMPEDTRNIE